MTDTLSTPEGIMRHAEWACVSAGNVTPSEVARAQIAADLYVGKSQQAYNLLVILQDTPLLDRLGLEAGWSDPTEFEAAVLKQAVALLYLPTPPAPAA